MPSGSVENSLKDNDLAEKSAPCGGAQVFPGGPLSGPPGASERLRTPAWLDYKSDFPLIYSRPRIPEIAGSTAACTEMIETFQGSQAGGLAQLSLKTARVLK